MARQGLLAQSRPAAATDTLLYSASVTESASAALKVSNDGTGATYQVAIRDYDQELVLDASTYKLHKGDQITGFKFTLDTAVAAGTFTPGTQFTSVDGEKKAKFESFFIPPLTTIYVKEVGIRFISLEGISGTFSVGDTITKGTAPDITTATVYSATNNEFLAIGPSNLATGSSTEFAEGDTITGSAGGGGTIAVGGLGTESDSYIFSETTAGGTYSTTISDLFADRVYRFDVSDASSMVGRDFKLSTTENGEFGPDGDFTATADNGTEYTIGKTTSGTSGDGAGAYVQYDFSANSTPPAALFWYDGGTGTASNSVYGGPSSTFNLSSNFTYTQLFVYDVEGTWVNTTDAFVVNSVTYTVTGQDSSAYGTVVDYTGTALKVILGVNSPEFAATDTFKDVPALNTADRSEATVSSVTTGKDAIVTGTTIANNVTLAANGVDNITSLVIGPGQRVHVRSATQNNTFSLLGFEDASSEFTTRVFGQS